MRWALLILMLVAATASAGYFGIHDGALLPMAYAALVSLNGQVGWHWAFCSFTKAGGQSGWAVGVGAVEGCAFSGRTGFGVALADMLTGPTRSGSWVPDFYGVAMPSLSVCYVTRATRHSFDRVTLQLDYDGCSFARIDPGDPTIGLSGIYSVVLLPGAPVEVRARAGFRQSLWGVLRHPSYYAGVGLKVGLGWWVMREN